MKEIFTKIYIFLALCIFKYYSRLIIKKFKASKLYDPNFTNMTNKNVHQRKSQPEPDIICCVFFLIAIHLKSCMLFLTSNFAISWWFVQVTSCAKDSFTKVYEWNQCFHKWLCQVSIHCQVKTEFSGTSESVTVTSSVSTTWSIFKLFEQK